LTAIGFLHTADQHVPTFGSLVAELAPDLPDVHVVDPSLLAGARAHGMTPELRQRLQDRLSELVTAGARVVVCTCSTLGEHAEALAAATGVPVLRADRPMAEAAVARGGRVAVVVAVESTLEPTLELLRTSAERAGTRPKLIAAPCLPAWPLFEAGDLDGYAAAIAAHARSVAPWADVLVLAQASMAPAAELLTDLPILVLTSPRTAAAEAIRQARRS
jgi:hypothetical protein